ncbi:forkhead box protein N2-like [Pristis pectinata]|uniref:forkhead box protein N2-like n=1 Tax=Pristis pectinata TaxID=685728 RepID=UPI00223D0ADF|nr:forkhead box protein N2-like [Pristis pectinata]XP_051868437.1 forkhead box protein N2-like [Pristis pectinata]XP_051868438.1 forkhead box protein N2-like [Pristis pectinata]XP_051868439.1 forkhead box protein N2-like [Pristis pectinata]XP_051868440.1 forkhead box protein N2-like [Pristis pectinata]XP_051868441.1 forkhead box protein N2-like [Pristis pectinata]XP_051868442.1 forkhead box protein N2-like [Pristis pectinata]
MGPISSMSSMKKAETSGTGEPCSLNSNCPVDVLPEVTGGSGSGAILVEKGMTDDEELTNLNWLHENKNLLKNFSLGSEMLRSVSPTRDVTEEDTSPLPLSDSLNNEKRGLNSKPPYSFSCLIFMAIDHSARKCLPVKDIYNWILERFPYFTNAPTGWKNSVRHNLSLNKCFRKVEKGHGKTVGKGSLWCVDPQYRPNLIQALMKTPYYSTMQIFYTPPASPPSASPPPHHLTSTSPQLRDSLQKSSDIDAATAMMLLNSSPEQRLPQCNSSQQHSPVLSRKRSHKRAFSKLAPLTMKMPETTHRTRENVEISPLQKAGKSLSGLPIINNDPKEDHNYSANGTVSLRSESRSSVSSFSSVEEVYEFIPKASRQGSDGSEGFHSDEESEADDCENESNDLLGASASNVLHSAGNSCRTMQHEVDEELKEAAGSLLHLAGLFSQ